MPFFDWHLRAHGRAASGWLEFQSVHAPKMGRPFESKLIKSICLGDAAAVELRQL